MIIFKMPNNTSNILTIINDINYELFWLIKNLDVVYDIQHVIQQFYIDQIDIFKFMRDIQGKQKIDFNQLYPIEEDDYSWCSHNWGTKWSPYEIKEWRVRILDDKIRASIFYYTAWYHPTNFYLHVSRMYPSITFKQKFADEGRNFKHFLGKNVIKNGILIKDKKYTIDNVDGQLLIHILDNYNKIDC